jgi:ribosomal protein S18 acetylase RimI-like enzyme
MDDSCQGTVDSSYHLKMGNFRDGKRLLAFMQQAYRELSPNLREDHLAETVKQLWGEQTPVWFAIPTHSISQEAIACLWLGNAIDQVLGDRYTHIFLLYVNPQHRRRGLGAWLMHHAETWAIERGYPLIGLHVFTVSNPARSLYEKLGYCPQAIFLQKSLI